MFMTPLNPSCLGRKKNYLTSYKNNERNDYRGADKSLARPGRKQATATEDFDFHISDLLS
jgi:hypothetical protein